MFVFIKSLLVLGSFMFTATKCNDVTYIDASNHDEIQQYADFLNEFDCYPFHPGMTDPIDTTNMTPEQLSAIMAAYDEGDLIEICKIKEDKKRQVLRPIERPPPGPLGGYRTGFPAIILRPNSQIAR